MNARKESVKIRPVILSGGSGTRLWPISRSQYPKQFAPLLNEESLFTATLKRVSNRARYGAPIIVSNSDHRFFILEALDQLKIKDATILLEPCGRNTAAAAIAAALYENEPGILHLVMPSDHLVADEKAFNSAVAEAAVAAETGEIVLFGITPTHPETGYGYIIPGQAMDKGMVRKITQFSEKPNETKARALIEQGALWNSGIFLYSPEVLREEAKLLAPGHYEKCEAAVANVIEDHRCIVLGKDEYASMEKHAFDTMIMEHTKRGAVLPCSMGWNDVGSWYALWQQANKDTEDNVFIGSVVTKDVKSSYIRSEGPTVAVLGMEDCMVIATKDAILVAPCSRAQEIKELLSVVEDNHKHLTTAHTCVPRPWGTYENIAEGDGFLVKHIVVKPGRSLSLQMHHHRAEHWVVVAGTARVECDGIEKLVFPNESVFVPQGATHRLSNPGKVNLQLIEVQSGDYLQEDDIVRFDDVYGRTSKSA